MQTMRSAPLCQKNAHEREAPANRNPTKDGLQFIENKREIECQTVAFQDAPEVVTRTDGFIRFQQEKTEKEGPFPPP